MGGRDDKEVFVDKDFAVTAVTLPLSGEIMTDLVQRRCYGVVHIRMGATPDVVVEYSHRLMTRLSKLVCR